VHFCGSDYKHWVISALEWTSPDHFRVWTTSNALSNRFTHKVLTEMTDLYFTGRSEECFDKNIRVIPCDQKGKSNCGYLALAAAVELALGTTELGDLSQIRFDEQKVCQWLFKCIQNKNFVVPSWLPIKRHSGV
jgi:hypothetical protein